MHGKDEMRAWLKETFAAFPDIRLERPGDKVRRTTLYSDGASMMHQVGAGKEYRPQAPLNTVTPEGLQPRPND
jgi:hypothetical protein